LKKPLSTNSQISITASSPKLAPVEWVKFIGFKMAGLIPLWSRDGHELFYQNGGRLMGVTVTPGAEWSSGTPRLVKEGRFLRSINGNTPWSVSRDGTRFLRIQLVEQERAITRLDLVLNGFRRCSKLLAERSEMASRN
jgi:hypothetical protein